MARPLPGRSAKARRGRGPRVLLPELVVAPALVIDSEHLAGAATGLAADVQLLLDLRGR